jgi:hypothetical protein
MLYTLYIGTEQGTTGTLNPAYVADSLDTIRVWLARNYGGYSESEVKGAWFDVEHNRLVVERSVRFEIVTDDSRAHVEAIAIKARDLLSQSSVLVIGTPVVSNFV